MCKRCLSRSLEYNTASKSGSFIKLCLPHRAQSCHQKVSQQHRRKKRNSIYDVALDELESCIPSSTSVEEFNAVETARIIDGFLKTLDRKSRIMFVRRYWHSDSIDDIAKLFGTGKHNISVRLSRTREKLKKYLDKEGVSL